MNWRKYFTRIQPASSAPFCEEVGLFEDAVNAILDGSEPWQIDALRSTVALGAFNPDEQRHLQDFLDKRITEKRKEIMRVALTKVLTGNGLEKGLANKVATLGKQEEKVAVSKGPFSQVPQSVLNDEYLRQEMKWQQEEMMQNYQAYSNNIGAQNVAQSKIENPFSSK
jgi:hypothetical protein